MGISMMTLKALGNWLPGVTLSSDMRVPKKDGAKRRIRINPHFTFTGLAGDSPRVNPRCVSLTVRKLANQTPGISPD
jgi:hypothetical protein